jgi:eukaryotic-like serine/threonine-protein kinase
VTAGTLPVASGMGGHRPRTPAIGFGRQGAVYLLDDDPGQVMKVFHEPAAALSDRLRQFAACVPAAGGPAVAWPQELILTDSGEVGAYVMARFSPPENHPMGSLFSPGGRARNLPQADWRFLAGVARNLASLVAQLHALPQKFVIGDLSPDNLMVASQGYVTLLDSDSMQFTVPRTGRLFPCMLFTRDYAPPELQGTDFPRSVFTDDFSLAVLVLQLLLCGDHPFAGQPPGGGETGPAENIRLARSHLIAADSVSLPRVAVPAGVLPPSIRDLARQALQRGHLDPRQRPPAARWAAELDQVRQQARSCPVRHTFSAHLADCPWCARASAGLPDPFGRRPAARPAAPPQALPRKPAAPKPAPRKPAAPRPAPQIAGSRPPSDAARAPAPGLAPSPAPGLAPSPAPSGRPRRRHARPRTVVGAAGAAVVLALLVIILMATIR